MFKHVGSNSELERAMLIDYHGEKFNPAQHLVEFNLDIALEVLLNYYHTHSIVEQQSIKPNQMDAKEADINEFFEAYLDRRGGQMGDWIRVCFKFT